MNLTYALPALLVIVVLITQQSSAYAVWPFPDEPKDLTYHGKNFDRAQIDELRYKLTTVPERIQDGPHWVNYKYYDSPDWFTFESANGAITFQKQSCTLKLYDKGEIYSGESALSTISHTDKEASVDSDIWGSTSLNDLVCDFSYQTNDSGVEITAKKSSLNLFGQGEEYTMVYRIDYSGLIEVIYKHYNNQKENTKYGFTQTLNGAFRITVGDQTYDTGTIQDTAPLSKEQIIGKTITIEKNGIKIIYDPQNYIHDYLWAMKIKPNGVSFDFTHAKGTTGVGATLEIDPTYGYTSSGATNRMYYFDGTTGTNCQNSVSGTATLDNTENINTRLSISGSANGCQVTIPRFDISPIPIGSTATSATIRYDVQTATNMGARTCALFEVTHDPATNTATTMYYDGVNVNGTEKVYVRGDTTCKTVGGDKTISLGANATSYITNTSIARGWFATSLIIEGTRDASGHIVETVSGAGTMELQIIYTLPPKTISLKPMQADNATSFGSGYVIQRNATNTVTWVLNSTGWATMPGTAYGNNYNYTIKDSLDQFVDNMTVNKAIVGNFNRQGPTNIYPISCDANPDSDEQVKVNFTSYHNSTYWNTPSCAANDDITALIRFIKSGLGPATNATTKIIMRVLDTANYDYSPSKVLWNGTSLPFTFANSVLNATGAQVADGYHSVRYNLQIVTDNVTSAPTALGATAISETRIDLSWTAPASNHGDAPTGYKIWRDSAILVSDTGSTSTTYSDMGLIAGSTHTYMVCAINRIGCSPWSNTDTETTQRATTGTVTVTTGVIGDTLQANTTVSITHASPSPVTVSALKLYRNGTLQETKVVSVSINNASSSSNFNPFWNRMTTGDVYSYIIRATVSNSTGTVQIASSNFTATREYSPSYFNAMTDPSVEGQVNYTLARFDSEDGIHLKVNRVGGTLGTTWTINCITQTNAEARATVNQSVNWPGTWNNRSGTGYFNGTWTGLRNTQGYVTCFNPPGMLFTTTSYTNSSLALFGIEIFDLSYGSMLGVPVGIFFLALAGGMANKRTAPTWIVVLLGMAGVMATIGFFTLTPIIWGLALVTGLLGLLVNQKVF